MNSAGFAVVVGKQGWKLDKIPLKLWLVIFGIGLLIFSVIPDTALIIIGIGFIFMGIILFIKELG